MASSNFIDLGKVVGQGVVKGGIEGDILIKKSDIDYDMEWRNIYSDINTAVTTKMMEIVGPLISILDDINGKIV